MLWSSSLRYLRMRKVMARSSSILIGLFLRRQKDLSGKLSSRIAITIMAMVPRTGGIRGGMQTNCLHSAWRSIRRPCTIGLATAVVLWGLGYKLSLYQQHPTRLVRASVAKLSIGPRGPSLAITSGLKSRSHLITDSLANPFRNLRSPQLDCMAFQPPMQTCPLLSPSCFIPSRSPPPQPIRFA
jgi:hypothetical protein